MELCVDRRVHAIHARVEPVELAAGVRALEQVIACSATLAVDDSINEGKMRCCAVEQQD